MDFDKRPEFFKIIAAGVTSKRLKIPSKFLKHISKEVSDIVILTGPSGRQWHAKLRKEGRLIYLGDGWQKFMSDHSLGDYEFLVFRYDGNMCFNVQIFDKNGCNRVNATIKSSDPPESTAFEERREPNRARETLAGFEADNNEEGAELFTSKFPHFKAYLNTSSVNRSFCQTIPIAFARANNFPPCSTNIVIQNPEGRAWEITCIYCGNKYAFRGGWAAFICDNKLKRGDNCIFELIDKNKMRVTIFRSSQLQGGNEIIREPNDDPSLVEKAKPYRARKTQVRFETAELSKPFEGKQHFSAKDDTYNNVQGAELFTSKFPHFKIRMNKSSVNRRGCIQTVPMAFARTNLPKSTNYIVLRNSEGGAWEVRCVYTTGKRFSFTVGWCAFGYDNKLKVGDVCIFELIDENKMRVNIFRLSQLQGGNETICEPNDDPSLEKGKPYRTRKKQVGFETAELSKPFEGKQHFSGKDETDNNVHEAELFTSNFPHFMVRMNKSSVNGGCFQTVPMAFARIHLSKSPTYIVLQNSEGRAWEVRCIYTGQRFSFSGGWPAFAHGNKLNVGDVCIFELIDKNKMRVNIFQSSQLQGQNEIICDPNDDPSL